ncbi:hypothetical protein Bca101_040491 [Brassica carinata]|uniref:Uncharacterized protein n=1 Tax=Brassica oleracea var. oleracea TaxID=109376 RepID=A0A0D3C5C7_BRAOL
MSTLMVLFLDILLFTRSKPGEERPGGSCSWILVTLNAEKVVNLLTAHVAALRFARNTVKSFSVFCTICLMIHYTTGTTAPPTATLPQQEADDGVMWRRSHELRTDETERIHMRLMNFVMLQELMKQLTNFKISEAMWMSSVKLGGVEVQSPKTRDGITTNENGDHDYVEYNNSSTMSPCQDHSPWLSA